jgi:hypothetical protein
MGLYMAHHPWGNRIPGVRLPQDEIAIFGFTEPEITITLCSDQAQLVKFLQDSLQVTPGNAGQLHNLALVGIADALFGKGDDGLVDGAQFHAAASAAGCWPR